MNIRRLLSLSGILTEAKEFTFDMESEVERRMQAFPPQMKTLMLDAVEIARAAGENGVTSQRWADALRALHPDKSFNAAEVFRNVMTKLDCCMSRVIGEVGQMTYVFSPRSTTSSDYEAENNATADAVRQQVALTDRVMKAVTAARSFTEADIVRLVARMGMPLSAAQTYAEHFIGQFIGSVLRKEGDRYIVLDQKRASVADTMAKFRDMASNPPKSDDAE